MLRNKKNPYSARVSGKAPGRTRTGDPRITNALRYQLRYGSVKNALDFSSKAFYDLTGNRTRVYAVRGRRLDRLTMRPYYEK